MSLGTPLNVYMKARSLLMELLGRENIDVKEAVALRQTCEAVSTRAAHLAGAGKQFAISRLFPFFT